MAEQPPDFSRFLRQEAFKRSAQNLQFGREIRSAQARFKSGELTEREYLESLKLRNAPAIVIMRGRPLRPGNHISLERREDGEVIMHEAGILPVETLFDVSVRMVTNDEGKVATADPAVTYIPTVGSGEAETQEAPKLGPHSLPMIIWEGHLIDAFLESKPDLPKQ
ncbi:hypothetical protein HYS97_01455 [Candidatus Daviesbacteria bacterium]|nr:hypothetical protein [Candidatus Daviesbacteria bacterium]